MSEADRPPSGAPDSKADGYYSSSVWVEYELTVYLHTSRNPGEALMADLEQAIQSALRHHANTTLQAQPIPDSVTTLGQDLYEIRWQAFGLPGLAVEFGDEITVTADALTARVQIHELKGSSNAYLEYESFFDDQVLDVTFFFGRDSREGNEITRSYTLFRELIDLGFRIDEMSFRDDPYLYTDFTRLHADSGAMVRDVTYGGVQVRVEVRIFHPGLFTESDGTDANARVRDELLRRDIIVLEGLLDVAGNVELGGGERLEAQEIAALALPSKAQLVYLFTSSQSLAMADAMMARPADTGGSIDVVASWHPITQYLRQGPSLIFAEVALGLDDGVAEPLTHSSITSAFAKDFITSFIVMGIEDNATMNPFANTELVGTPCASDAYCGNVSGNRCVFDWAPGPGVCTYVVATPEACLIDHFAREIRDPGYRGSSIVCAAEPEGD
jgi:hypothetical protein